ncbi:hypothetical protein CORC01_09871 [Colletotrichum orchidophilum]|uniref:Uncharacterized protein n=1 Tax=Colletotrichum orchidophilum TaxID=1209926 RepID=A0A1G4B0J4_9PEZI|nr:uncharacterized protein CORC01_09871 [Colletotrichum orchidophilum]OHE94853.1 hypothetical protein CORC01_09871 [Colletotrichum orchidophilum]
MAAETPKTGHTAPLEPRPIPAIPWEHQRPPPQELDPKAEEFRWAYHRVKLVIELLEFRSQKKRSLFRDVPTRLRQARQKKRTMKMMIIEAHRQYKEQEMMDGDGTGTQIREETVYDTAEAGAGMPTRLKFTD